jgi:hypothetical protein
MIRNLELVAHHPYFNVNLFSFLQISDVQIIRPIVPNRNPLTIPYDLFRDIISSPFIPYKLTSFHTSLVVSNSLHHRIISL